MKKITRALCLMLAVILCVGLFAGCHPKDEIALDFGEYKITSGTYACAIVQADMEARQNVYNTLSAEKDFDSSKKIDYLAQKINGVKYSDWVKDRALKMCQELVYIQKKAAELNLKLDDETKTNAKNYADYNWSNGAQYLLYNANGVAYDTYFNFYLNTVQISEYFLSIYGKDGTNPAKEEDVLKTLYDNYDLAYYISVSYVGSDGKKRDEKDIKADKALFDSYAEKINKGTLTFKQVEELWKKETEKRAEEEKKNDTTSSNTTSNTTSTVTSNPSSNPSSAPTSSDTSSGNTSSEEPFSKPADESAYLIGTDKTGSNYAFEYFDKVHGLDVGKAVVVEEKDTSCMLFVRGNIKADYYYEKNYYESALSILKYSAFEADYQKEAYKLEYKENKYATGNFTAKKVNYDDYNAYQQYMQYYGG